MQFLDYLFLQHRSRSGFSVSPLSIKAYALSKKLESTSTVLSISKKLESIVKFKLNRISSNNKAQAVQTQALSVTARFKTGYQFVQKILPIVRTATLRERSYKRGTNSDPSEKISFSFPCCEGYFLTTFVFNTAQLIGPGLDKSLIICDSSHVLEENIHFHLNIADSYKYISKALEIWKTTILP